MCLENWRRNTSTNMLDIVYKDIPEYPKTDSYFDRLIFYRTDQKYHTDIDVCENILRIHLESNPLIYKSHNIEIKPQSPADTFKYQIHADNVIFRGETLVNCLQLLIQLAKICDNNKPFSSKNIVSVKETILLSDIYKNTCGLPLLIEKFIYNCYTPGNFLAIPYVPGKSLNQAKGKLKEPGYNYTIKDSAYTYLTVLFNYFDTGETSVQLTKYIDTIDGYNVWRNYRIKGRDEFIQDNILYDFANPETILKFKKTKYENPVDNIVEFMTNINAALEKRTERLQAQK